MACASWPIALLLLPALAGAEPYVALRGGAQSWDDTSNRDQIESGTELGYAAGIAIGDEAGLSDVGLPKSDFALDLELEAIWRREPLHGRNRPGEAHRTADGHDFDLATLSANLWPGWQATRWLTLYAGGGAGAGMASALGSTAWAPFWQVGAGWRANLTPELSLEAGYRAVWLPPVRLDGYRASYEAVHGLTAGVRWEFKQ